jgi:hypothetical protein
MSIGAPAAASRGTMSAALPRRPIDSGSRRSRASTARRRASSTSSTDDVEVRVFTGARSAWVDLDAQDDAVVHRDGERLRAAHPPRPAVSEIVPASVPPRLRRSPRTSRSPCRMPCVPM